MIVDSVKGIFDESYYFHSAAMAQKRIPSIRFLVSEFCKRNWPVVFSADSSQTHTRSFWTEIADKRELESDVVWFPKPRFSAFFKTDLDAWLRRQNVTLCAVGGVATHLCVLSTVMDALCYNYKTIFIEDGSASISDEMHNQTVNNYRRNVLDPLLRVMSAENLMKSLVEV